MKNILPFILTLISLSSHAGTQSGALSGASAAAEMVGNPRTAQTREPVTDLPTLIPSVSNALRGVSLHQIRIPSEEVQRQLASVQPLTNACLEQCRSQTPAPAEHVQFGISFINFSNRTQATPLKPIDCTCLVDNLQGQLSNAEFEEVKRQGRQQLNDKILKSVGKKFVNEFATNIEDISFFMDQTKEVFTDQAKAESLQCNNESVYNSKITELCGSRGITDQAFIQKRKDLFINSLAESNLPFEQKIGLLTREVMGSVVKPAFDLRGSDIAKAEESFARKHYDATRMELVTRDPESQFLITLMSRLLQTPEYRTKIQAAMTGNKTPVEALINVIEANKGAANFFSGLGVGNQARTYLKDRTTIENGFKFFMQIHPGFHIALKDRATFARVSEDMATTPGQMFISSINDNKNIIQPFLEERCNKMVNEFANAVCLKDELVLASVDPLDVQLLMKAENPSLANQIQMSDLLMCETKKSAVISNVVLDNLAGSVNPAADFRQSDYLGNATARATGKAGATAATGIGALALVVSSNPQVRTQLGQIIDQNQARGNGFTGPGVLSQRAYAEDVMSGRAARLGTRNNMTKEDARKYLADSERYEQQRAVANSNNKISPATTSTQAVAAADTDVTPVTNSQNQAPAVNPVVPQIAPSYVANQATVASNANAAQAAREREALRDYVANKDSTGESVREVDNMDDATVAELNRLRGEKQALLEQSYKEGNARLEEMRTRLAEVTAQTNRAPASTAVQADSDESLDDDDSDPISSARNPRTPEVRPGGIAQIAGGQTSRSLGGASTGGASGAGPVSTTVSSDATVAPVTSGNQAASSAASQSSGLVISGVQTAAPQGQELNQEVQKFLASSELNATAIQDIKTKGIKIRYSVMENNKLVEKEVVVKYENLDLQTRNAIDLKLARKTVSNQVSKLAVLRLIMGGNQTR